MFLHPLHLTHDEIQPVPGDILPRMTSELPARRDGGRPRAQDLGELPEACLFGLELTVAWPSAETALCAIPLLFSDAALRLDLGTGLPLLVIAAHRSGHVWCVLVKGGRSSALRALARLGAAGAVRQDLETEYVVEKTPFRMGSTAAVFNVQARSQDACAELVGKVLVDESPEKEDSVPKDVCREVSMLAAAQGHPNVTLFHGAFRQQFASDCGQSMPRWVLLMERCHEQDLFEAVLQRQLEEEKAQDIMESLLSALEHLHRRQIVHRDVKPENVLMARDGRICLTDFGLACSVVDEREMRRRCGSPGYTAPEVIKRSRYGPKVDCFSAGVLLYFIVSSTLPFASSSVTLVLRKTMACQVDFGMSPAFQRISYACQSMILMLLQSKASSRLSAQDALCHPWLIVGARATFEGLCCGQKPFEESLMSGVGGGGRVASPCSNSADDGTMQLYGTTWGSQAPDETGPSVTLGLSKQRPSSRTSFTKPTSILKVIREAAEEEEDYQHGQEDAADAPTDGDAGPNSRAQAVAESPEPEIAARVIQPPRAPPPESSARRPRGGVTYGRGQHYAAP